jgi:hypothetical protein
MAKPNQDIIIFFHEQEISFHGPDVWLVRLLLLREFRQRLQHILRLPPFYGLEILKFPIPVVWGFFYSFQSLPTGQLSEFSSADERHRQRKQKNSDGDGEKCHKLVPILPSDSIATIFGNLISFGNYKNSLGPMCRNRTGGKFRQMAHWIAVRIF